MSKQDQKQYTAEKLLKASSFCRMSNAKGVLTSEEALEGSHRTNTLVIIRSLEEKKFFFSNDHCFGVGILPKDWVPCTSEFPRYVTPRSGLEDGICDTIEKYIRIFHHDEIQIQSMDELLAVLNK